MFSVSSANNLSNCIIRFLHTVIHSLSSSCHSPSLPPSSSCTSRPRSSGASRNKLLRHRVAAVLGWIPRLIRCKTPYSRCACRLHPRNIASLHKTCVPPSHHVCANPTTCYHVNSILSQIMVSLPANFSTRVISVVISIVIQATLHMC